MCKWGLLYWPSGHALCGRSFVGGPGHGHQQTQQQPDNNVNAVFALWLLHLNDTTSMTCHTVYQGIHCSSLLSFCWCPWKSRRCYRWDWPRRLLILLLYLSSTVCYRVITESTFRTVTMCPSNSSCVQLQRWFFFCKPSNIIWNSAFVLRIINSISMLVCVLLRIARRSFLVNTITIYMAASSCAYINHGLCTMPIIICIQACNNEKALLHKRNQTSRSSQTRGLYLYTFYLRTKTKHIPGTYQTIFVPFIKL